MEDAVERVDVTMCLQIPGAAWGVKGRIVSREREVD